jgi:hypothetical protein
VLEDPDAAGEQLMSSYENHSTPVRVKNNVTGAVRTVCVKNEVTGALRTWRHLSKGGHATCVLITGFGYLLGYWTDDGNQVVAFLIMAIYAVYCVVMTQQLTDLTE